MKLAVLTTALLSEVDLTTGANRPEFRKATRKMKNCLGVAELALSRLPPNLKNTLTSNKYENMCTILGTSLGEIEVTRDFLVTLDQTGMARPILFQNSLHNSVNGFITLTLGLRGPSITVSNRFMTSENALTTAELLMGPQNPFAMVICGEIVVEDFMPGYSKNYPGGTKLRDGASAVFLATEEAVREHGLEPKAWIQEVRIGGKGVFTDSDFYDSNGLEKIIASFEKARRELQLTKPDGSVSTIIL
jgi:hypothetical protein